MTEEQKRKLLANKKIANSIAELDRIAAKYGASWDIKVQNQDSDIIKAGVTKR